MTDALTAIRGRLLVPAVVIALTALVYLPSLNNGFTNWDDTKYLIENWTVRDPSWAHIKGYFTSFQIGHYYPLTLLSLALDHRLFGLDARGHHAVSLLLHLLNTALIYLNLRLLGGAAAAVAIGALLFGIHPLHVESVAWISGRNDLLCTFFYLGGLAAYLRHLSRGRGTAFLWTSGALFVLALLAKSMAVSFPLALLLCDYLRRRKIDRRAVLEKVPFFLLSTVFAWVAYLAQQQEAGFSLEKQYTPFDQLFLTAGALLFYLGKTVLPVGLSAVYPFPDKSGGWLPVQFLLAPLLVALLAAAVLFSRRHTRSISFGAGVFFVTLLPALMIVPQGRTAFAADRYTYLPFLGICYLASAGFSRLLERFSPARPLRISLWALALCSVAALSWLTRERSLVWRDSLTLWSDVIARYPGVAVAYNNRGMAWAERGDHGRALADYRRSMQLDPSDPGYALNYAGALYSLGRYEEAAEICRRALAAGPNHELYNNLGMILAKLGRAEESIDQYRRALFLKPDSPTALVNLGVALAEAGRLEEAIEQYRRALRVDPYYPQGHFNLAVDLESLGRLDEAAGHYRSVLRIWPGHPQSVANLRRILLKTGR